MRIDNFDVSKVLPSTNMNATITGNAINVESMVNVGLILVYAGAAPTGTFSVQYSNAVVPNAAAIPSTSWVTDASLDKAITASGSHITKIVDCGFKWMRLIYTFTSGTGTISVCDVECKGV